MWVCQDIALVIVVLFKYLSYERGISMANISTRIDDRLKANAEQIADSIGIPLSTAINIFIKRFIAENGFPFEVKATYKLSTASTTRTSELEDIVKHAIADPNNLGVPQHFSYFDPVTNQVVTKYNGKE